MCFTSLFFGIFRIRPTVANGCLGDSTTAKNCQRTSRRASQLWRALEARFTVQLLASALSSGKDLAKISKNLQTTYEQVFYKNLKKALITMYIIYIICGVFIEVCRFSCFGVQKARKLFTYLPFPRRHSSHPLTLTV